MKRQAVIIGGILLALSLAACSQYSEETFTDEFVEGFTEEGGTEEEGRCAAGKLWNEYDEEELEQIAEDPSTKQDEWLPLVIECIDEENPDGAMAKIKEEAVSEIQGDGITQEQAECMVDAMFEELGLEQLYKLGVEENAELTPEQEQVMTDIAIECVGGA